MYIIDFQDLYIGVIWAGWSVSNRASFLPGSHRPVVVSCLRKGFDGVGRSSSASGAGFGIGEMDGDAIWANAMGKLRLSVLGDVRLDGVPSAVFISDLFAIGTGWQYAAKRTDLMLDPAQFHLNMYSGHEFGNSEGLGDIIHGPRSEPGKDFI